MEDKKKYCEIKKAKTFLDPLYFSFSWCYIRVLKLHGKNCTFITCY